MPTTTQAKINSFMATAIGKKFDPDHAFGFQCMDTFLAYAIALFGGPVNKTAKPSNAKLLYDNAYGSYWIKTRNDPKKPSQLPKKGDVIVYGGAWWNGWYGHTGIVESANKTGVTILMQDGFLQSATKRKTFSWSYALPIGWLTPRLAAAPKPAPAKPNPVFYTVKRGDTLSAIASRFKTTVAKLMSWNKQIKDKDQINVGWKLRVK